MYQCKIGRCLWVTCISVSTLPLQTSLQCETTQYPYLCISRFLKTATLVGVFINDAHGILWAIKPELWYFNIEWGIISYVYKINK